MAIPILKAVLVIVILGVMILLLIGINHMFSGSFSINESEIDDLRHDVIESEDVISDKNIFTELVKVKVRNRNSNLS